MLSEEKVIKAPLLDGKTRLVTTPDLLLFSPFGEEKPVAEDEERTSHPEQTEAVREDSLSEMDARTEGEKILSLARREAERLLEETRLEIESKRAEAEKFSAEARKEGYESGYEQGYADGIKKAEEDYEKKLQEAEAIREEAERLRQETIRQTEQIRKEAEEERRKRILESEDEILKLAFAIAEKIIGKTLKEKPNDWLGMVQEVTKRVAGANELTIRVSREDEEYLVGHLQEIQRLLSESPRVTVVTDSSLEPGDFILQSDLGQIDARIKQQLAKLLHSCKEEAAG